MGLPVYENLGLSLACSLSNAWEENTQKKSDLINRASCNSTKTTGVHACTRYLYINTHFNTREFVFGLMTPIRYFCAATTKYFLITS